jgi:hypothetical protein
VPKRVTLPPAPDSSRRFADIADEPTVVRPSPSSNWLNSSTGAPSTDIFGKKQRARKRGPLWLAGRGAALLGRGVIRLGRFGFRQTQPMRVRDWITVAALLVVLIGMGAYMTYEKRAVKSLLLGCRWHTVEVGDTLISLARSSGMSVGDIASANGVYDVEDPPIGQQICLPSRPSTAQAAGATIYASHADGPVIQGEAAYVRFALPFARRAHDAIGWPVSMILAQWGLEQGWQAPTFTGYNFGNCGGLIDEPFISGTAAAGSPPTFAYADSPEDGLRFYLTVAKLPYYSQIAQAASHGGPEAAARALGASPWDAGHYTDRNDPGSSLIALMQQYNLQQYD